MKTIEITSGDQKVVFTTKSVTFDGQEFLYANMTNVIHSTAKNIYTFTYGDEVKLLPYDEKDEKTLNAIFGQVQKMTAQKKPAADGPKDTTAQQKSEGDEKGADAEKSKVESDKSFEENADSPEKVPEGSSENASEKTEENNSENVKSSEKKDDGSESQENSAPKNGSVKVSDVFGKFKSKKSTENETGEADSKDAAKAEAKPEVDPEKAARRKKSLKIFGIVLAVLFVLSIAYYYLAFQEMPLSPEPTDPNTTESHQYDEIDDLINDLQ